jgi:multidrug efflux pump subunit AcrB
MVKFLIDKPVAVIMVYVALLLLGVMAMQRIPISPLPNIDIPEITVHLSKKNTSAMELEQNITSRFRGSLQQVSKLEDIHSETRDGYAILRMRFNYGTDLNYAFIEVNEKIDQTMNGMPKEVERPRVVKASVGDIPVYYINLRIKDTINNANNTFRFMELRDDLSS